MKKTLIVTLALVFVLGIVGTAFAANPFVDVPAKHWAYDAVSKLAKAGVVDGFGDGTFRGDKTMTRYEMAQIVAKAMAKSEKTDAETKALIDKLAVEFSAELDNLGVRVTKLEKKMGPLQWSGDARVRYLDSSDGQNSRTDDRLRLYMKADINDKTAFDGAIMAKRHNEFGTTTKDDNKVARAAIIVNDINSTGTTLTLGRQAGVKLGATGYFLDTWGMVDGARLTFGNTVKVNVGYADFAAATKATPNSVPETAATADSHPFVISEAYFINADVKTSKATTVSGAYLKETNGGVNNFDVYVLGFNSKFSPKWSMAADYVRNTDFAADDRDGMVARVFYKGANKSVPHSWGVIAEYDKWETGSFPTWSDYANASLLPIHSNDINGVMKGQDTGNEFIGLTVQYTPAKNIVMSAFQQLDNKDALTGVEKNNLTKFQVDFYF